MNKRSTSCHPLILTISIFVVCIFCHLDKELGSDKQKELVRILRVCAEYCEKLANASIHFVCEERILEEIYHYRPGTYFRNQPLLIDIEQSTLVYEFQFSLDGKRIEESRTLLEEDGRRMYQKGAKLKMKSLRDVFVLLEPVRFLDKDIQKCYQYKIVKKEKFGGNSAIVIEAIPNVQESGVSSGKIWVRDGDFCLLRIEWVQKTLRDFEGIEKAPEGMEAEPHITFVTEFLNEKNGILFPSKHFVREAYLIEFSKTRRIKKEIIRSETTVAYKDYRVKNVSFKR